MFLPLRIWNTTEGQIKSVPNVPVIVSLLCTFVRWVIKSASLIAYYFVFVGYTAVNQLIVNYFSLMMVFVVFFAGYISQVLKNYTDHACDGEYVSLRCPHRTTISIQSSFYGRIVPSHQLCPSRYPHSYATLIKEDVACSVGTSLQVLLKCIS